MNCFSCTWGIATPPGGIYCTRHASYEVKTQDECKDFYYECGTDQETREEEHPE